MPAKDAYWCEACQDASVASGKCLHCGSRDVVRLTKRYAKLRLLQLEIQRDNDLYFRRLQERLDAGPVKCPKCGSGPGKRDEHKQRFLDSSGSKPDTNRRRPGSVYVSAEGSRTITVRSCNCMADPPRK